MDQYAGVREKTFWRTKWLQIEPDGRGIRLRRLRKQNHFGVQNIE